MAKTYASGRRLSAESMALWMNAMAEYFPPSQPAAAQPVILDLGCGTGRFSVPLAERFNARVVGVEPSEKMRAAAQAGAPHPRVRYLAGCAEAIPCEAQSLHAAFLSMVVHHFRDLPGACRELWRVLKPGGLVVVRTDLQESRDSVTLYRFFPTAKAIGLERCPTAGGLCGQFAAAGFECLHAGTRVQEMDPSLKAHYQRCKLRSVSTLAAISEAEFAEGLEKLRRAAEAQDPPQPVREAIGFFVFRKPLEAAR